MDGAILRGIAVPYDQPSGELRDMPERGTYREIFQRGAFGKISESVALYVQHDPQQIPIARVGAGTLRFTESNRGLEFEASISPARTDIIEAVARKDLAGASVGFRMKQDRWITNTQPATRRVVGAELFELSLVVAPAYNGATISTEVAENG
tara:strand:- start:5284 stop:5739 length:456 start_codon:yes stop_codon:yes gene_type:complete